MQPRLALAFALLLFGCDPPTSFPTVPSDPPDKPEVPDDPEDPGDEPGDTPEDPTDTPPERPADPPEEPTEPPKPPGERPAPPERPTTPERPTAPPERPADPNAPPEGTRRPTAPPERPAPPEEPTAPPEEPVAPPAAPTIAWAADLSVADVLLYQGSSVALTAAGPAPLAATDVPVVAGRETLVRVLLQPGSGWVPRPVVVALEIEDAAGSTSFELEVTPYAASTEADLASSANFSVPGEVITPDAALTVSVVEALASRPGNAEPRGARFPAAGAAPLLAVENGGVVEIWFVPLLYAPDGSSRAPDTSAAQIELLRSSLERQYPVSDVLVDVLPPVALAAPMAADGAGWSDALYQVSDLRDALAVPDDVYLYGLVEPASDFGTYCRSGCVAGLSWVGVNPDSAWTRSSLGLGYTGDGSADTFTHEVGHAHGRQHSPCGGPASPDPDYPNGGGRLGTWGWDMEEASLIDPATHGDLMSYCRPRWVSDYTFAALSERVTAVNAASFVGALPGWPRRFGVLDLPASGAPSVRASLNLDRPPEGKVVTLELLDDRGRSLGTTTGTVQPFEHLGASAILFEAGAAAAVRYDGQVLPI